MKTENRPYMKRFEVLLLFITAGLSVLIASLDISGLLDSSNLLSQRIPSLTLLCAGFIASYLILERRGKIEDISTQLMQLTQGVEVIRFASDRDAITYYVKAFKNATKSIDQASIDIVRTQYSDARKQVNEIREKVIELDKVKFRYIATLYDQERLQRAKRHILDRESYNYFAGFYIKQDLFKPFNEIPVFSFTILDDNEVFTRSPFEHGEYSGYIVIRNQHVVKFFRDYYSKLWDNTYKLKTHDDYNLLLSIVGKKK